MFDDGHHPIGLPAPLDQGSRSPNLPIRTRRLARRTVRLILRVGLITETLLAHSAIAQPAIVPGPVTSKVERPQRRPVVQSAQPREEEWRVIYLGDDRVGYSRLAIDRERDEQRSEVVHTLDETWMTFKRFGQELKMEIRLETRETRKGDLLWYDYEFRNPPAATTRSIATVKGGVLKVETTVAGQTDTQHLEWRAGVKSPGWQDRTLQARPMRPGEKRRMQVFLPELNKVTDVTITADRLRRTKRHDGEYSSLLKVRSQQSILPDRAVISFLDESGTSLRSEMPFLPGLVLTIYKVDQTTAMEEISGAELDIAVQTLIPLKKPMRRGHRTTRAVYRVVVPRASEKIPSSDVQLVRGIASDSAEVTVLTAEPPERDRRIRVDAAFTSPTRFLQANDHRVSNMARKAVAGQVDPWKICLQMERYVHRKLKSKSFSTALASAAEVAKTLEGDCTEHAVLLAAMLRSQRIPSRIAVGLVYVESQAAFGGHMWTEAWLDGRWIPLDATLGRGGIGAAHIKLADSSFADDGPSPVTSFIPLFDLLGNMEIDVVEAE